MTTSLSTSSTPAPPVRLLSGFVLLAFGVLGLLISKIPVPAQLPIALTGLPPLVASLCALCAIVVILSSIVDKADGDAAVGAYPLIGRWFWWLGMTLAAASIGLALARVTYVDDLMRIPRLASAATIMLLALLLFAFLSQQRARRKPQDDTAPSDSSPRKLGKPIAALVLCGIAGFMLHQRYTEMQAREANFDARDKAERNSAPPWKHDLDAFRGGMSVEEVIAIARSSRHHLRCFNDLRSENRIHESDRTNCHVMIGDIWGIPGLMTAFAFGDAGLRHQLTRFPSSSWPLLESHLDTRGRRVNVFIGLDHETRQKIIGWRIDSGLIMSVPPAAGSEITVLWTAKEQIATEHCPYQGPAAKRNPQRFTLPVTELWPEIDCRRGAHGY